MPVDNKLKNLIFILNINESFAILDFLKIGCFNMQPVNIFISSNSLVPQVSASRGTTSTWDSWKMRAIIRASQGNSYTVAHFDKIDALPIPLLIELFQKLHTAQRGACGPLSRAIYFDVTKFLSSPGLQRTFEEGCKMALGFNIPRIMTNDRLLYSFLTQERSKPKELTTAKTLPDAVWGRVFSFLDTKSTVQAVTLASSFTSDTFLREAFKGRSDKFLREANIGREDELASDWIKKFCAQNGNSSTPIQLPPLLAAIKGNVRKIHLSQNVNLTPFLLKSIALFFPNIEEIDFPNAHFHPAAECIHSLQNFPHLKALSLQYCSLTDNELQHLQHCRALEKLNISCTESTGSFFSVLPNTLKELDCSNCPVVDESLKALKDKTKLKKLDVSRTKIRYLGDLPDSLEILKANCENLIQLRLNNTRITILDISEAQIHDESLDEFPQSIKELYLSHCEHLTDVGVKKLRNCTQLEKLTLFCNRKIYGLTFSYLPPSLKKFDCQRCSLKDEAICLLKESNLTELDISGNHGITGKFFDCLPDSLESLSCEGLISDDYEGDEIGGALEDVAIEKLKNKNQLKFLNISYNPELTGSTFSYLPISLEALYCQGEDFDTKLRDEAIEGLQNKSRLETLYIGGNLLLTGNNFHLLPPSIKYLSFETSGDNQYTDEVLKGLLHLHLVSLDLTGQKGITGETFDLLPDTIEDLSCFRCENLKEDVVFKRLQNKTRLQKLSTPKHIYDILPHSRKIHYYIFKTGAFPKERFVNWGDPIKED